MYVNFVLYGLPEDGSDRFFVHQGQVQVSSLAAAEREAVEAHWDRRLDSASCSPQVELDEVEADEAFDRLELGKRYWFEDPDGQDSQNVVFSAVDDQTGTAICKSENALIQCYPHELEEVRA